MLFWTVVRDEETFLDDDTIGGEPLKPRDQFSITVRERRPKSLLSPLACSDDSSYSTVSTLSEDSAVIEEREWQERRVTRRRFFLGRNKKNSMDSPDEKRLDEPDPNQQKPPPPKYLYQPVLGLTGVLCSLFPDSEDLKNQEKLSFVNSVFCCYGEIPQDEVALPRARQQEAGLNEEQSCEAVVPGRRWSRFLGRDKDKSRTDPSSTPSSERKSLLTNFKRRQRDGCIKLSEIAN